MKLLHFGTHSPLRHLYQQAGLPDKIRRSLNIMILANMFGTMHAIICGGGTSTMIGFASSLGAGIWCLESLPDCLRLLPCCRFHLLFVSAKQKRKRYLLTFGLASRALWLLLVSFPC